MVEFIACIAWIRRNDFDVGESNTGSEKKHLKRWKGEGVETKNIYVMSKSCNDSGAEETWKCTS